MDSLTPEQLQVIIGQFSDIMSKAAGDNNIWSGIASGVLTILFVAGSLFFKNAITKLNTAVEGLKELQLKFTAIENKVDKLETKIDNINIAEYEKAKN